MAHRALRRPISIATGCVGLKGLDALAGLMAERDHPSRLLLGAVPEALAGPAYETVIDRFEQLVAAVRREWDFSVFPAALPANQGWALNVLRSPDSARRITEVVKQFGLHPVPIPRGLEPISEDDLGGVCYRIVLPA